MLAYVDKRVGSIDLVPYIQALGCEVRTAQYEAGDVWFVGNGPDGDLLRIGIERKNIRDFASSLASGRLMGEQKHKLLKRYDRVYLLVEGILRTRENGTLEELRRGKWMQVYAGHKRNAPMLASALTGALASAGEFAGMRVLQSGTPQDTARVCVSLLRWWQKDYEDHSAHDPVVTTQISDPMGFIRSNSMLVKTLAQVNGVGSKRAREIAEQYGTVEELVLASREDLQSVCGPKTGETIWRAIRAR
jgi:ERCC4-type nuclease